MSEFQESRHFDHNWADDKQPPGLWKPSDGYVPRRDRWTAAQLVVAVLIGSAAVVWIALEVAKWIK